MDLAQQPQAPAPVLGPPRPPRKALPQRARPPPDPKSATCSAFPGGDASGFTHAGPGERIPEFRTPQLRPSPQVVCHDTPPAASRKRGTQTIALWCLRRWHWRSAHGYTQPSQPVTGRVRYRADSGRQGRRCPLSRGFGGFTLSSRHGAKWRERQYLTRFGRSRQGAEQGDGRLRSPATDRSPDDEGSPGPKALCLACAPYHPVVATAE